MTIQLSELVDAANAQLTLENDIAECEERLKRKKEEHRRLSTEVIPNMMSEVGLESLTLPGGMKLGISDVVYAKLPDNPYKAFQWLRINNMDGVIKTSLTLDFGKGEDDKVQAVQEMLAQVGYTPNVKSTIHHMTLRALVKEQLTKGTDIPLEDFGAGTVRTSVIKE